MSIIIFDEADLQIRDAIFQGDLCGRDAIDNSDVFQGSSIDLADLCGRSVVDQGDLCALNSTRVDTGHLCTVIGVGVEEAIFRFDTTRITFDNTSLDWSYSK